MSTLAGDWPEDRLRQAARRYETLRRIPPYLHTKIWVYTLKRSTLDQIIDRIADEIERDTVLTLAEIVNGVLE